MPNEIKEPKVLKETTKQVYDFMKAENLLFEFDRKQVLRLIIEALSVEDINAMKNAKDEQERKKIYQNLMKKYHPDKNPDNKDDGPVDIQKLDKLLNDPQKFADIYIRDAKRAGKDMPSDEEEAKKLSDEQMVNIIRSVLAKLNTNPKTKKPYTPEEKTADLALKLINDNIKSGNVLLSKFIRIAKTKYGENFQDKFKQIITSATEGWKQQTTGIDPEDQKRVNAFAEKVQAAFKPVIDKIAEAFKKTELFSDPDWVGNLYDILQQNKLNEEVTDEEVLKFVGLKADPDGKLAGEQSQNLGKIVQALKKLKQKMIKDVEAYMGGGEEPDLEENILRVVKETLREQQIDPEGDDNIEAISTWQSKNNEFYEKAQKFLKGEYDGKGLEGLQSSFQSLGKPVLSEANYNQKEWFKGKKTGVFKSISEKNLNEAAFLLRGEIEKWTQGIENAMNELRKSIDSKPDRKAIGALKQRLRVWIDIYGTAEKILENYAGTDTEKKQELTPQKKEQLINVAKDATMFVKAYELIQKTLSKLLGVKPPEEIVIPDMQKLINPPKGEISPVIDDDPVVDDDPVKKDEQEDFGFAIERETFLSWYEDGTLPAATQNESLRRLNEQEKGLSTLQTIEDFEEGFVTEPMLQMQSMIFRNLYSNLLKLEDREFLMKFPQASLTAPRTPDEIEQTRGQQLKEEEEEKKEGVPFDEEDIQVFKDEYNNLLRLAKKLKTEVLALNIEEIETLGGAKVVDDARSIAVELQESLGKVHDTVENELSQFIDAGKKMNEAQEFDTETNQEKSEKREQNRQDRGKKVVGVYKAVRGYMTKLDQLVRKNESGAIDGKDLFMYASEARAELDKIKSFFPSFAPLGKMVDNPEKMIKQLKRFAKGLVRDIMDVVEQLRGIAKSPMNEQAVKATTDKKTVRAFIKVLEKASRSVQDYFDAPSMIGKVKATRASQVDNMKTAAAEGPGGDKAIEQGKAEEPDRKEKEEGEDGPITSLSQAKKLLSRTRTELNKFFNAMVMRSKLDLGASDKNFVYPFFKMIVLLRNKDKKVNEVDSNFQVSGLAHLQQLGLDKVKVKELNILFDKFKQDPTPAIQSVYRLINKFIGNKKAVDHYNEKFSELLKNIGEDFEFTMPATEIANLIKDNDPGSKEETEKEWESQQFIRDMNRKIKQEFPDADEKEIIKQTSKEVFKAANEAGDIPEDNEEKKEIVKDIVDKVKTATQEEEPTDETGEEIPEEQKEDLKTNIEQEIDKEEIDTEELKADEPKQEEIADKAAEKVIDELPPDEKPKTEEEKTELKKTLIDIALEEVQEFLKGTRTAYSRVSIEDAKKLIETDAYKILTDYAKEMDLLFGGAGPGRILKIEEVKEFVEKIEGGIKRINASTRAGLDSLSEVRLRRSFGEIGIEDDSIMDPLKNSYTAIQEALKKLKKGLKENDRFTDYGIITPFYKLRYHFRSLRDFDQDFREAIKQGDEELAQKALEDQEKAKEEAERKAKEEAAAQAEKKHPTPKKGEYYKYIEAPSKTGHSNKENEEEYLEEISDSFGTGIKYRVEDVRIDNRDPKKRVFQVTLFGSVLDLPRIDLEASIFHKTFRKTSPPKKEEPFKYDDDPPPPQRMARQIKVGKDGKRTGQNVFVKQEQLEKKLEILIEHYLKNGI